MSYSRIRFGPRFGHDGQGRPWPDAVIARRLARVVDVSVADKRDVESGGVVGDEPAVRVRVTESHIVHSPC